MVPSRAPRNRPNYALLRHGSLVVSLMTLTPSCPAQVPELKLDIGTVIPNTLYVSETEPTNLFSMLALDWEYAPSGQTSPSFLGRFERTSALQGVISAAGWTALSSTAELPGDALFPSDNRLPIYRLPDKGPAEVATAGGETYLFQVFRRSDGTGWAQWFQGQSGLLTTWPFTSAQFNPMPVGGPFGGVVTVSNQTLLPGSPPPTDPLAGTANPNPTDPVLPNLHCFLSNMDAGSPTPPATTPLSTADQILRDLLVSHAEAIRQALQTPPTPPEEEPFNAYDALGQRKTDFFRLKKVQVPLDLNLNYLPDELELQTSYGVVINEAVYASTSGLTDSSGQAVDWVELRNITSSSVSMAGWGFTLSSSLTPMVVFGTNVVIPANGYILLLASGKGSSPAGISPDSGELHFPFTLPDTGGYLALLKPSTPGGTPNTFVHRWNNLRSPSIPATGQDVSWGITYNDNGSISWAFLDEPTPGADNSLGGYNGLSLPPEMQSNSGPFIA